MTKRNKKLLIASFVIFTVSLTVTLPAYAAGTLEDVIQTLFGQDTQTVDIILLMTVLTLLPSIVVMLTGFTRITIVLGFLRNALGMQQTPPNQVMIGLALFLTMFVMGPVITTIYDDAYVPYSNDEITTIEFYEQAMVPLREFMLRQTYKTDINFFIGMSKEAVPSPEEVPNKVLIPAFITSEIKQAFQIGFFIYIPFIVIDMVVASTLMAMGMMMLPPAMISLPFKVLLFVLVDGWQLVIGTVVQSFR
jgi:flagellar biosynthetic protein FliP